MNKHETTQAGLGQTDVSDSIADFDQTRIRLLFESAVDPMYTIAPDGSIRMLNAAWQRVTGLSREDWIGKKFQSLVLPQDLPNAIEHFQQALQGKIPPTYQTRYFDGQGQVRVALHTLAPVINKQNEVMEVVGIARDITDQLACDRRLKESEERYNRLFQYSHDGIVVHDLQGTIVDANMRAEDQFGYPKTDLLALPIEDLISADAIEKYRQALAEVSEVGYASFEIEYKHKQGSTFWAEVSANRFESGGRILVQSVVRDISDRIQAQQDLRRLKQEWEEIFEKLGQPTLVIDSQFRIVKANRFAVQLYGRDHEQLVGKCCYATIHRLQDPPHNCPHAKTLSSKKVEQQEVVDDDRTYLVTTSPITNEQGKISAVVHVSTDITEQKAQVEKMRQLERTMQQAQKLESLGLMAGGIAHDFNNLLVGVIGNADLIGATLTPQSPIRPLLEGIQAAANQLSDLTNQMLAYSGRAAYVLTPLNLSGLVREIAPLLRSLTDQQVSLEYALAQDLPATKADGSQIRQVMINLVHNAIESMSQSKGTVLIKTGVVTDGFDDLGVSMLDERVPPGRYVYLQVCDTGSGIKQSDQFRVFEPFYSTKFTGRGLGLASVLGIVRAHQGQILLDSKEGQGSRFLVLLPAIGRSTDDMVDGTLREASVRPKVVLLVDDEEMIRTVAAQMLEKAGFAALTATDGQAALEMLGKQTVDAVILDLTMPVLNGYETFKLIRADYPTLPVILSSGYSEQAALKQFGEQSPTAFIQKPFRLKSLSEALHSLIAAGSNG